MNIVNFEKGINFVNDTYYIFKGKQLDYFLDDCINLKNREFFCTSKNYSDSHKTAIYIEGKENITLDFSGATLFLHGDIQPIIITKSKNIEIKNLVVKYDRSFFTEMTIIERSHDYLKVKVDPRFPYEIKDGKFIPKSDYWRDETLNETYIFLQEFDPITREGISWPVISLGNKGEDKLTLPWGDETCSLLAYQEGEYVVFRGKNVPPYRIGSILELCMNNRDISAITMFDSSDLKVTNFRLVNGLGMGILPMYCKNVTLDGYKLFYDENSVGFVTNTADGFHADACSGDIIIKNCIFEGTIDDAINIHSNYYETVSCNGNRLLLESPHATAFEKVFGVGDRIRMYKLHSMKPIDEFVINQINRIDTFQFEFVLDREIKEFYPKSLVENLSTQPNIYISDSKFGKANTHLRFQTRGKVRVTNVETSMDLLFTGDTNYWFESSPNEDSVFENVKFTMPNKYGVVSIPEFKAIENAKYYHKGIVVKNCIFASDLGLYIRFSDQIELLDSKSLSGKPLKVVLDHCGEFKSNIEPIVERTNNKGDRDE